MPPLRPLPDLVLIGVFKQLTPNSQLTASRMSNRCYLLVRAANRRVKLLNISDYDSEFAINPFDLSYEFNDSGQFGVFSGPPVTPFTKWKHLKLLDTKKFDISTVERIVTIFSSVTSLTFATTYNDHCEELIALLQQPQWVTQLTSCVLSPAVRKSEQVMHRLMATINALPALQHLAYDWWSREVPNGEPVKLPELTILSQLKTIAVHTMPESVLAAFERSIDRHAAGNADLQVYLLSWRKQRIFGDLQTFSESFRSRIVRFRELIFLFADVPPLCNQFPRLIYLSIYLFNPDQVRLAFSALTGFRQLTSLMLDVQFSSPREGDEEPDTLPARPVDQLHSVRVLTFSARSASHDKLRWLNLGWTLPHLKTLIVRYFFCESCQVRLNNGFRQGAPADEFSKALGCLRESFLKVHSGVCPSRIFIQMDLNKYRSAEELLMLATNAEQGF